MVVLLYPDVHSLIQVWEQLEPYKFGRQSLQFVNGLNPVTAHMQALGMSKLVYAMFIGQINKH